MTRAQDFCDAIGLSEPVRRWLRKNEGDTLREDTIRALLDAFDANCPDSHQSTLRFLIIQIHRRIKTIDENRFLV